MFIHLDNIKLLKIRIVKAFTCTPTFVQLILCPGPVASSQFKYMNCNSDFFKAGPICADAKHLLTLLFEIHIWE